MCFKNKWRTFEPTTQYLSVVSGLTLAREDIKQEKQVNRNILRNKEMM